MDMDPSALKMPQDFPDVELRDLEIRVGILDAKFRKEHNGQPCDEWRGFTSACNGFKTRFRAMTEAEQTYVKTVPESNDTRENVYVQDTALFSFFTNAVSVLEVLCYACYGMASQLQPSAFPMKSAADLRKIAPHFVRDRFLTIHPKESLTAEMSALLADPAFEELKEARNILSHRGNPPRHYSATIEIAPGKPPQHKYIGGSKGEPPTWNGIRLDAEALTERRAWVVDRAVKLLTAALKFAGNNIRD